MTLKDKKYYCKDCPKEINFHTALYGGGRCRSCALKNRYKVGLVNFNGKNHPQYKDGRCSKVNRCVDCGEVVEDYRSERCFSCNQSFLKQGLKNPNWKNGLGTTPLVHNIRMCFKYRQWRSDVFTRDDFTCQECSKRGGNLNAHHTPKRFAVIIKEYKIKTLQDALNCEELWNINNGITLCTCCHRKVRKIKSEKGRGD